MKTITTLHKLFAIITSLALSATLSCGGDVFKTLLEGKNSLKVVSVTAVTSDTVRVDFSEPVDKTTAETISNYQITGLTISSATLSGSIVTLTTNVMAVQSYPIVIQSVKAPTGKNLIRYSGSFTGIDTIKPYITGVTAQDVTNIMVTFSEPMDKTLAETESNYTIAGYTVANAALQTDTKQILLTLGSETAGEALTLNVSGLKDTENNTMVTAPFDFTAEARPTVTSVEAQDLRHILVRFSEQVELSSAEDEGNYSITGYTIVPLTGAVRQGANNEVLLTITSDTTGGSVPITVSLVRDNINQTMTAYNGNFTAEQRPYVTNIARVTGTLTQFMITFNEAVTSASSNCSSQGACEAKYGTADVDFAGPFVVTSAALQGDPKQVLITVDHETQGGTLKVDVFGDQIAAVSTLNTANGYRSTAISLEARPYVASAAQDLSGGTLNKILVTFSEAADKTTAETKGNYTIAGFTVNSAVQQADTRQVLLTLSAETTGGSLTLATQNVKDSANFAMTADSDSFSVEARPYVVSAAQDLSGGTLNKVLVTFSEAVDKTTAETKGNYTIAGFTVNSAAQQADTKQVLLTLSADTTGGTLTLATQNVKDGNNITMNLDSDTFSTEARPYVASVAQDLSGGTLNKVLVTFSEAVDKTTAETKGNYTIAGFTISSAVRQADTKQVLLTLSTETAGGTLTLATQNVKDMANFVMNADSDNFAAETRPSVSSVAQDFTGGNLNKVLVTFSEKVDKTSAEASGNYSITAGGAFTISSAAQQSDTTVLLTLNKDTAGETLTLDTSGVKDGTNILISMTPDSRSFSTETRPYVVSVAPYTNTVDQLLVTFSEAVDKTTAETKGNYTIAGFTVNSAAHQADTKQVLLTLSTETTGGTLTLNTSGVKDGTNTLITMNADADSFTAEARPNVTSVQAQSLSTVLVTFSEAVDLTTAETESNYTVTGYTVNNAVRQSNTNQVLLTLSTNTSGTVPISVSGVKDSFNLDMTLYNGSFISQTRPSVTNVAQVGGSLNNFLITFSEEVKAATTDCSGTCGPIYSISNATNGGPFSVSSAARQTATTVLIVLDNETAGGTLKMNIADDIIKNLTDNTLSPAFVSSALSVEARPYVSSVAQDLTGGNLNRILVTFSEAVQQATAETTTNYTIAGFTVNTAVRQADTKQVLLTLTPDTNGGTLTLDTKLVQDTAGFAMNNDSDTFSAYARPYVSSVAQDISSGNLNKIMVTFSEAMDKTTAETTTNYTIAGFTVSSAAQQADTKKVLLTLTTETNGGTLTLGTQNVKSANAVTMGSDTDNFSAEARPRLTSADSTNMNTVTLIFSEPVNELSSECSDSGSCATLYSISDPTVGSLVVNSAARSDIDHSVVVLTTANQLNNTTYTLTVGATVCDEALLDVDANFDSDTFAGQNTDTTAPSIASVTATDLNTIYVLFDNPVTEATAEGLSAYSLSPTGTIQLSVLQPDNKTVELTTLTDLPENDYTLTAHNIRDLANNLMVSDSKAFEVYFTPLSVTWAYEYDCDHDGKIDEVVVQFNRALDSTTINKSDAQNFKLSGTSFINVDKTATDTVNGLAAVCSNGVLTGQDPGSSTDEYITLFTNDTTVVGTGKKTVAYTQDTLNTIMSVKGSDILSKTLATFTATTSIVKDKAAPIIARASADTGDSVLIIGFSEPVSPTFGGWTTCSGNIDPAGDITYLNVANGLVSGLSYDSFAGDDINACDEIVSISTTSHALFNEVDLYNDEVYVPSSSLFDGGDNSVYNDVTHPVVIKGVIKPYVLSVTSQNTTTARVTFSEDMTTGTGNTESADYAGTKVSCDAGDCKSGSYTYTLVSGSCTPTFSKVTPVAPNTKRVFDITTNTQDSGCVYKVTVNDAVLDFNELAPMTAPKYGQFPGAEKLKVVRATATSLYTFEIEFSRDVKETGANGADDESLFTLPTVLAANSTEFTSVRDATRTNVVLITHKNAQGVGMYTVTVSNGANGLKDSSGGELAATPLNVATFMGFGGSIEDLEDGPIFSNPFADGTSYAFSFEYGGKIYLGPNESNKGVFRFDPDGSNSTLVTFKICTDTSCTQSKDTFGANLTRRAIKVDAGAPAVYYMPPGTVLSNYANGSNVVVSGCTNGANNGTSAATIVDDANDTITITGKTGVTSTTETCEVMIYNQSGPNATNGVDAFVKGTIDVYPGPVTKEILLFGGHDESGGLGHLQYTYDSDNVLDIDYCVISSVTLGNTKTLQEIFTDGKDIHIGLANDKADRPVLAWMPEVDRTGSKGYCGDLTKGTSIIDAISNSNKGARYIDAIGPGGAFAANNATNIGIESITRYDDGGGVQMYIANNNGVARTPDIPLTGTSVWTAIITDDPDLTPTNRLVWDTGHTRQIPSLGALRPGQKGIPFMTSFKNAGGTTHLYVARNRDDNTAEVWRCATSCGTETNWSMVFDTAEANGVTGAKTGNYAISMMTVTKMPNDKHIYIGFDNITNGAHVFRSTDGNVFEMVGIPGLGPTDFPAQALFNKHIVSHASIFYDGKSFLYVNAGCLTTQEMYDGGACDRDTKAGSTDFAIKVFRQIDAP